MTPFRHPEAAAKRPSKDAVEAPRPSSFEARGVYHRAGPASFLELMAALGSKDGREIVRALDTLYAAKRLGRNDDGRYVLKDN